MIIIERIKDTSPNKKRKPGCVVATDEFVQALDKMFDSFESYEEACAAYLAWAEKQPGNPQIPNNGLSEEHCGIWHLWNINGPLAVVTAKGEVFPVDEFYSAYERLSEEGKCDSPGGMEYCRVFSEWIEENPADLDEFIIFRANMEPWE